jgi:uncharacterized membrane protein (UPF0127 family)
MQAREDFHKAGRSDVLRLFAAMVVALLPWACAPADEGGAGSDGSALLAEQAPPSPARPPAGYAWVIFGADTVVAEVAATAEERSEGLMYRDEVPDGTGMLFVFPDSRVRSFWMANTYVALDIAYLDPSFQVVDIMQMEPLVTESYVSNAPAMYGLEVRQGWFGENGIEVGAEADIVFGVAGR